MLKNSTLTSNGKPLAELSVAQKLELYQIIASAETGDTKCVIERARKLLKAAKEHPEIPEIHASLLRQHSVSEILEMASRSLVTA
jgi:hypothetical protein